VARAFGAWPGRVGAAGLSIAPKFNFFNKIIVASRILYYQNNSVKADDFRWNDWNLDHATKHGCQVEEIEFVVRREVRGNRQRRGGNDKWMVNGRGQGDRIIQVAFLVDDEDQSIYVIHAMPVSTRRRRR
jgi:uncharacterized DUF497 family protein